MNGFPPGLGNDPLTEPVDDLPIIGPVSRFELGRPVRDLANIDDVSIDGLYDLARSQQPNSIHSAISTPSAALPQPIVLLVQAFERETVSLTPGAALPLPNAAVTQWLGSRIRLGSGRRLRVELGEQRLPALHARGEREALGVD